jgi:xyloglucan-specific exo-beta-1,4-glucanase
VHRNGSNKLTNCKRKSFIPCKLLALLGSTHTKMQESIRLFGFLCVDAFMSQQKGSVTSVGLIASSVAVVGIGSFLMKPVAPRTVEFDPQSISSVEQQLRQEYAKQKGGQHSKPGYYEALRERLHLQAFPYDRPDVNAVDQAIEHAKLMPKAEVAVSKPAGFASAATSGRVSAAATPINPLAMWQNIGPKNLEVPYNTYYGPPRAALGGRVGGLAYDPENSEIMYIGAPAGGIWKTTDGGINWVSKGDSFGSPYVGNIAVCPSDSNLVIAGLGDRDGGAGSGNGVLVSEDAGETWTNVAIRGGTTVSKVLFHPTEASTVYLAMQDGGGLFKSTDRGQTWSPLDVDGVPFPQVANLVFGAPDESGNRQLIVRAVGQGMFISNDEGASWAPISEPGFSGTSRTHFDASHINFGRLYYSDSDTESIYQGDWDGTDYQWTDITGNLPNDGYNWSQSWYDHHITVATHNLNGVPQDFVYSGLITIAVWNGQTWTNIGQTYTETAKTHNDQHCMAVFPGDESKVVIGNDGGVWPINYNEEKKTWEIMKVASRTLPLAMFYSGDWHPTNEFFMMGGTQDNASPVSIFNIANWVNRTGGDGCGCALNPLNPMVAYGSAQFNGLYRTSNGWQTQTGFGPPDRWRGDNVPFITRMSIDPSFPNPLYVHTNYLSRFNPQTNAWDRRLGGVNLCPNGGTLLSSSVAPSNPNIIYAGGGNGNLWRSADKGATWRRLDNIASLAWSARPISSISVSPTRPNDIIVTLAGSSTSMGRVVRIEDTSITNPVRTNLSGSGVTAIPNISANKIVRDNLDPDNKLYVANDIGVFVTTNGGSTWQNMSAPLGLPICEVKDMKWTPKTGYLNIATYGRGMWRLRLLDIEADKRPVVNFFVGLSRNFGSATGSITVENAGRFPLDEFTINDAKLTLDTGPTVNLVKFPVYFKSINYTQTRSVGLSYKVSIDPMPTGNLTVTGSYRANKQLVNFTHVEPIALP